MKKSLVITVLFVLVFATVAYATQNPFVSSGSSDIWDGMYKGAAALLLTAFAALITSFVPTIATRGNTITDAFFENMKEKSKNINIFSKKEENGRVAARLDNFLTALDSAADAMFKVIGKVRVVKDDNGKIVVENLDEVTKEAHDNVMPRLTNSTKDMAKGLGLDAEEIIKSFIREKAGRVL